MLWSWSWFWLVLVLVPGSLGASSRLYSEEDQLVILSSSSLQSSVSNSSSAWLVQFFSSWCGHCIQYSSTWKALAQDVKGTPKRHIHIHNTRFGSVPGLCRSFSFVHTNTRLRSESGSLTSSPVDRSDDDPCYRTTGWVLVLVEPPLVRHQYNPTWTLN
ncbi:sulfhydryl oxidase 1-like [Sebastes umbrosus]|uniref:sulfhydryl oxidase 1-like n=1 Tax=Sebastes umbrosus TaxID=72105 RepID=UPI00189E068D|nr:sulfhydryl oxidase 1-like [Sebastes umbrosus]XP_037619111.1 sulfhydryl oxidase 1-like [Sebastes umbrosus]